MIQAPQLSYSDFTGMQVSSCHSSCVRSTISLAYAFTSSCVKLPFMMNILTLASLAVATLYSSVHMYVDD